MQSNPHCKIIYSVSDIVAYWHFDGALQRNEVTVPAKIPGGYHEFTRLFNVKPTKYKLCTYNAAGNQTTNLGPRLPACILLGPRRPATPTQYSSQHHTNQSSFFKVVSSLLPAIQGPVETSVLRYLEQTRKHDESLHSAIPHIPREKNIHNKKPTLKRDHDASAGKSDNMLVDDEEGSGLTKKLKSDKESTEEEDVPKLIEYD
ncbi:hypothetical protein NEOLEDRAFT_1175128 [Neolentinus lepideus HHB14362 ss-1]|uniref:Uncharacterized protein n=1 Tax=Neolentinus lepideus HHB14362 ss-1 TaxID=1314782 RepID=A0A165VBD0_9AGAM|nr:hypothetical protein NEOLEDRAFT_1175128 [Neolentinus lepideus HHB14362 ss-1]